MEEVTYFKKEKVWYIVTKSSCLSRKEHTNIKNEIGFILMLMRRYWGQMFIVNENKC